VLLGIWLLFWLGGIATWFTLHRLRDLRHDDARAWQALVSLALVWAIFLGWLAVSVAGKAREAVDPALRSGRWLWFLDAPLLVILMAGAWAVLWGVGLAGWQIVRRRLWRAIDRSI
jgi:hypothetical protein